MKTSLIIIAALILAGCTTTGGDFCLLASPIRPSASDVLTEGTARQILTFNETGARVCAWKP